MSTGQSMGLSTYGRCNSGGGISGGGDISLSSPEQSRKVYFDQAHYGTVFGSAAEAGAKSGQRVVGARRTGFRGDAYGGSGGGTDIWGEGDRLDGYGDGLNQW